MLCFIGLKHHIFDFPDVERIFTAIPLQSVDRIADPEQDQICRFFQKQRQEILRNRRRGSLEQQLYLLNIHHASLLVVNFLQLP